ncbi:TetR family transcriptional regulator [Streptomyces sp. NPDC050704]|uniref:TetR/AcrR family transcriptional regulator n=1 Tax=Streptomyces sp. NPDC050704 TaxID=3157219 RepID=UPI00341F0585
MAETSFVRARRPEHKQQRREAILTAARELATESGVRHVSLGNVAAAVGLAKSNLARYFATREEIFLVLITQQWRDWADEVLQRLRQGENVVDALAEPFASRPLFCDLLSELATTLQHNVSVSAARDWNQVLLDLTHELAAAITESHPALTKGEAFELVTTTGWSVGALYPASNSPATLAELYAQTPELAATCPDFLPSLKRTLAALVAGLPTLRS